ncbi:MAG: MBL fold metallo-hydrolase [Pseudomonadota bacterium]|nr:MBL fold metallo-hydrolase [Pseudomonadota bacterium]
MAHGTMNRRVLLKRALGGFAGLSLAPLARYGFAAENPVIVPVTDGLVMLTGAGGNILVRPGNGGQVLVDSGAAESTELVLAALGELPSAGRVQMLFNTHWHLDQIGGNATFGRSGATIIAHEKTRAHLATDYYLPVEDRYEKALPSEAHPTETFFAGGETLVDDERVEYGHLLEAHTDGDSYIFFRDSNVVAVGDAVSPVLDPVLDWFGGGWLGGRVEALETLLEVSDEETRIVPSYGPVVGRTELQAEYDMTLVLFDRMLELIRKGMSAQHMLDAGLMEGLYRTFDDPFKFAYDAYKGYWAHHNSLAPNLL